MRDFVPLTFLIKTMRLSITEQKGFLRRNGLLGRGLETVNCPHPHTVDIPPSTMVSTSQSDWREIYHNLSLLL